VPLAQPGIPALHMMAGEYTRRRIVSGAQPILSMHGDEAEGGPPCAGHEAYLSL
jgi:hypothetical protein